MTTPRWGLRVVNVFGFSMRPTYDDGDRLMARRSRRYAVGDVVVFTTPDELRMADGTTTSGLECLVKRVAAVAGDPVPADMRTRVAADTVPPGHLLVRGDNPDSLDSRRIGLVPLALVQAKVVLRLDRGRQTEASAAPTSYREA